MPEFEDLRLKTGKLKYEQIKKTGAKIVVTPCENCRLQIGNLNEHYSMGIEISSMMDFVADNMVT
jgi:Fe-S oxidoreductase